MQYFDKISINDTLYGVKSYDDRKIVFHSDSYGTSNWPAAAATALGLTSNSYYDLMQSGAAFNTKMASQYNFLYGLQNTTFPDPRTDYTDIVVCAGRNEIIADYPQIMDGLSNYYAYVKQQFPNAKLHIGFIGWDLNTTEVADNKEGQLFVACSAYMQWCVQNGVDYLTGVENILHDRSLFQEDGKHPNEQGGQMLGNGIAIALSKGAVSTSHFWIPISTSASGIASKAIVGANLQMNDTVYIIPVDGYQEITLTSPQTITASPSIEYEIATFRAAFFNGGVYNVTKFPFTGVLSTGTKFADVVGYIKFDRTKISLVMDNINVGGNNYTTLENVTSIRLNPTTLFALPIMLV